MAPPHPPSPARAATTQDVEAAMRFYEDGEGSAPSYDQDMVTNQLGGEDASLFDDIDNNEAYAADEYIVAGIPEAAPKKRREGGRGRGRGGPVSVVRQCWQARMHARAHVRTRARTLTPTAVVRAPPGRQPVIPQCTRTHAVLWPQHAAAQSAVPHRTITGSASSSSSSSSVATTSGAAAPHSVHAAAAVRSHHHTSTTTSPHRAQGGSAGEGDDNLEQAKAIDRMREMEDRMVMEAAMEENFGDGAKASLGPSVGKLAMWDWLMEADGEADIDNAQMEDARLVGPPAAWGEYSVQAHAHIAHAHMLPPLTRPCSVASRLDATMAACLLAP